ncbi:MAG TPA: phosphatase PAP2 family protein [Bdellovibrionota bacterium]|nr:phosphatase PAP2 family protein [Bdellovibrionota bacterium]
MVHSPITWSTKLKYTFGFSVFFVFSYILPNKIQFFKTTFLPLFSIDHAMPFLPWTIYIYLSEYFIYFVVLYFVLDVSTFRRMVMALVITMGISGLIFVFWPTEILRPIITGEGVTYGLFSLLHLVDSTVNCFPSQHVALVSIPPLIFWRTNKKVAIFFSLWAILVSLSTLTTKQHYLVDIFGGVGLALLSVLFSNWWEDRKIYLTLPTALKKILP